MLDKILDFYMQNVVYEKDESGYILAYIPGENSFFSQGENYEQARNNIKDAIEGVITIKLINGDKETITKLKAILKYDKNIINA